MFVLRYSAALAATIIAFGLLLLLLPDISNGKEVLLPKGGKSPWKYLDDGSDQKSAWREIGFDDGKWKSGKAPLGYGEQNLGATIAFGPNENAKIITTYFRTAFKAEKDAEFENLAFFLRRDDGAVIYLNGKEVLRSNMRSGVVNFQTTAARALGIESETEYVRFIVPPVHLKRGKKNVVAVEVHQSSARSSDLFLDLEIVGYGRGETPKRDFYADGRQAASRGNVEEAIRLLSQVPPESENYATAMVLVGHELYAQTLGEAEKGVAFVKKAYGAAPDDMTIVRAYIRTHVLARSGLSIDTPKRKHASEMPAEFAYIGSKIALGEGGPRLSGEKLLADLDYLEEMLVNCYSYLERRGANWEQAIDALRLSVKDGATSREFAFKLSKFLSIFGDGHVSVSIAPERILPEGYASFVAGSDGGRIFLRKSRGFSFLDNAHPYVREMDGVPMAKWLNVARYMVPAASPQWQEHILLGVLPSVGYLRAELGLDAKEKIKILLESKDGKSTSELTMPVNRRPIPGRPWLNRSTQELPGKIGYLRLASMGSSARFLNGLKEHMNEFRDTKGLIIDVRGNGGGSQDTLKTLLPYFLKPDQPMKIVNVAAYRMPVALPKPNPSGFLGLYGRGLHPAASKVWTAEERKKIEAFLAGFKPSWKLPEGKFSDWHVMAVKRTDNPDAYYYEKPLVILSDGGSFSATDNFLGAFKGHPDVTIMGTTSGGGSGRKQRYTLPNSQLPVVLCQMASYSANGRLIEGNGVLPDVEVRQRPENHIGKGDAVLEAALQTLAE